MNSKRLHILAKAATAQSLQLAKMSDVNACETPKERPASCYALGDRLQRRRDVLHQRLEDKRLASASSASTGLAILSSDRHTNHRSFLVQLVHCSSYNGVKRHN